MKHFPSVVVGDRVRSLFYNAPRTVEVISEHPESNFDPLGNAILGYLSSGSEWRAGAEVIG